MLNKLFLTGIVLTFFHACAQANETITWRIVDWPPFYILQGPDKGQGIYDSLLDQIILQMPSYHHKKVVMNTQRLRREFTKKTKVCSPSALSNTPALLSNTNSFLLPHQLIYHQDDFPSLKYQPSVSLVSILKASDTRIGVATQRYPRVINDILAVHLSDNRVVWQNNYNSLIRMFFRRRFDMLIEYPPVINYAKHMLGLSSNYSTISLDELSSSDYLPVHFACSDNDWGKQVIHRINQLLSQEAKQPNYLAPRLRWYEGEEKIRLTQYYHAHYLDDKKTPFVSR
ncbi:hypothetical protein [Thalassotalea sp. PP2-459]|uniref:hypothetical protein n=1 Tax=Thalassotalea sp. PP2-459 TaxID=1742724 RepID=UPI00094317F1|nr:hypothetical protein [Thalassotalea sp. PP2-459]OKY24892.1 hypothetical protein BI291_04845 [Thalassotalea sp. PP2-459]